MRNIRDIASVTGVGTSAALAASRGRDLWSASMQLVVTGTVTYNVEVSNNRRDWHVLNTGLTASALVDLAAFGPVEVFRFRVTAGTGSVRATVLEQF